MVDPKLEVTDKRTRFYLDAVLVKAGWGLNRSRRGWLSIGIKLSPCKQKTTISGGGFAATVFAGIALEIGGERLQEAQEGLSGLTKRQTEAQGVALEEPEGLG